jgi:hypothetical protein
VKAAVLTISDGVAAGERDDESGALLVELLEGEKYEVEDRGGVARVGHGGAGDSDDRRHGGVAS